MNLRITYAGGFRAPQAFDEDLHVGVVGGERLVTVLADNLKEEHSNSLSVSADLYRKFGSVQTNLLIEGFTPTSTTFLPSSSSIAPMHKAIQCRSATMPMVLKSSD